MKREAVTGDIQALEPDELALAAGGVAMDRFQPEDWPEKPAER